MPWGGGPVRKVSSTGGLVSLVAAAGALWGLDGDGSLWKVATTNGDRTLFAGGGVIQGFVVDTGTVFWTRGSKLLSSGM